MTPIKPQPAISIIIPAFNAAPTLEEVLDQLQPLSIPVLVVDDGSTDGTAETARREPVWKVVSHPHNRGKGAALKTGFNEASEAGYTHVLTLDADGQHPVEAIPAFLMASEQNEDAILVGNRFADDTIGAMPWVRRLSNGFSSTLISLSARIPIPDAQCGMRIYPLRIFEAMVLESDGYAMETEVLVKAGRLGIKVENIPISCHYPAGTSTSRYRALVDSWRIAKAVVRSLREGS